MKLYLNYEDYSLIYTLQQTDEDTFEDLTKVYSYFFSFLF